MRKLSSHFNELTEAFDKPYKFQGGEAMKGLWAYEFRTDDRSYIMVKFEENEISDEESSWAASFEREGRLDVTGEGDAMRIFATVIEVIKTFTKKVKPDEVRFSAEKPAWRASLPKDHPKRTKELGSREKLYKKLVQRYAGRMGYKYSTQTTASYTDFTLVRK